MNPLAHIIILYLLLGALQIVNNIISFNMNIIQLQNHVALVNVNVSLPFLFLKRTHYI